MKRRLTKPALAAMSVVVAVAVVVTLMVATSAQRPAFPDPSSVGPRAVAGVVFVDENSNGQVDAEDSAMEGIEVRAAFADGNRQSLVSTATSTAADGSFVVVMPDEIRSERYFVEVSLPPAKSRGDAIQLWHEVELGESRAAIAVREPEPCEAAIEAIEAGECGTVLLPDLRPIIDGAQGAPDQPMPVDSWWVDDEVFVGRRFLRFASLAVNEGSGPLHVIADQPEGDQLPTIQRVWTSEFSWIDEPAGAFVYHPGHQHIHLDEFERYRLLSVNGAVVAEGGKVSFCLRDSIRLPGATVAGLVVRSALDCGTRAQAINPGFGDYYGANLDDQWIDVTGVPAGRYLVEIVVDPENRLLESDESNNLVSFEVNLD